MLSPAQPRLDTLEAVPLPVLAVAVFAVLEAWFLFLVLNATAPHGDPLAFENLWARPIGRVSLQQTLLIGNVVLALLLWLNLRVRLRARQGLSAAQQLAFVGAGLTLLGVQWGCRILAIMVPQYMVTRIHP